MKMIGQKAVQINVVRPVRMTIYVYMLGREGTFIIINNLNV